jgi:dTDP-4-amino-4,6-dideoxy-D-galactose acyltransferase
MVDYNEIHELSWDSAFFGYNVGKIEIKNLPENVSKINAAIEAGDFDVVYCYALPEEGSPRDIETVIKNASWVDGRITYVKRIEKKHITKSPSYVSTNQLTDQLYDLAIQAGEYSRFRSDERFSVTIYKALYQKWIEKSVKREIADEVLVHISNGNILGMITIGSKKNRADIGLLSVDNAARGNGIGKALLEYAENYAAKNGFEELQVVTQQQNVGACSLYEKLGFKKESIINIFHIWK